MSSARTIAPLVLRCVDVRSGLDPLASSIEISQSHQSRLRSALDRGILYCKIRAVIESQNHTGALKGIVCIGASKEKTGGLKWRHLY